MVTVLVLRAGVRDAFDMARSARPLLLVLAAALLLVMLVIGAVRWGILLRARGLRFGAGFLFRVSLASVAVNCVLPTALGGDVLRMLYTSRPGRAAEAISIVFVDRALGLVGLLVMSLVASLVLLVQSGTAGLFLFNLAALAALAVFFATVFLDVAHRMLTRVLGRITILHLGEKAIRVVDGIRSFRGAGGTLGWAFLLSFLLWIAQCLVWYSLGLAVGAGTSLVYYLLYVPVLAIVTMLPISIGGVGVRENGFAILMQRAGMPETQAITIALFFLMLIYLFALVGGAMLIWLRRESPPADSQSATEVDPD